MKLLSRTAMRPVCLAAACVFTSASIAQEQRPIVITGSLLPRSLGSEIAATSVLTRADLERAGVTDLVSALRLLGSAQVEQLGGSGTTASVRLRGADTRDTLVLVDGVPLNDVTTGQASLQQIPVEIIERIEVVRGNLSALYGGNATGGVIQVFTRRGSDTLQASASVAGGSRDTAAANASIAGALGPVSGRLTLGAERTDGFSAGNTAISNPDDDGNRRRHASLALDARIAPAHELGLDLRLLRGDTEYDSPGFGSPTDTQEQYLLQRAAVVRGRHGVTDDWSVSWRAADGDELRRDSWVTGFGAFSFGNTLHNRVFALDASGALVRGWTLQLGGERVSQSTDNTTYTRNKRRTDVLRAGAQHDADWGELQANVRRDETSDFGGATTGLLGGRWKVDSAFSVNASWSTSFTPPTLDFLFFDCSPFSVCSNPDLRPEKSRNADLGVQWQGAATLLRATLFDVRYRDKIVNMVDADGNFIPMNVGRAKNRGVELAARTSIGTWQFAGEAVFQNPVDADSGDRLPRRPRRQAALRVDYDAGAYGVGTALRYVGSRPDVQPDTFMPKTLPSYTTVDLNARWHITPQWTVQASAENVFDRRYEPAAGYNGRPRGVLVSLGWRTP